MFRRLTDSLTEAASSAFGTEDPNVKRLVAMGFDHSAVTQALRATDGNADRAAEMLLSGSAVSSTQPTEEETLQRVMQESLKLEQERQARQPRTAAMSKAAQAAARRTEKSGTQPKRKKAKSPPTVVDLTVSPQRKTAPKSTQPVASHPNVKIIPKLQDKSKEEQILRCTNRLKPHAQAVDTLHRALVAVQGDPDASKYRSVDMKSAGYQRSLASAPGAQDLLKAMSFRVVGTRLMLDRARVDPALLYLGISGLEQVRLSPEYQEAKKKVSFVKEVQQIRVNVGEKSARAALTAQCPEEPSQGRGALMQIVLGEETIRRRFDGDDTLEDVLNWLGGHGTLILERLLSREWCLVDMNRFPALPLDCVANKSNTLQYIGCWPSGRLELLPSSDEWKQGVSQGAVKPGSSRGLASAPSDTVY